MYKSFLKSIFFSLFLVLFVGCGEVVLSDPNNPTTTTNTTNNTNIPQAEEVIINTQPSNQTLEDIVKIINTMSANSNNEKQKTDILNWIDKVALEVSELTAKDLTSLVASYRNLPLYAINDNLFSTDKSLRTLGYMNKSLTIIKGSCTYTFIENSIVLCTENFEVTGLKNDIVIANGSIKLTDSGGDPDDPKGSILYTKKSLKSTSLNKSVILFAKPITFTRIQDTDCINTTLDDSSQTCNEIRSSNLR